MSIAAINPNSVKHAIEHGLHSRADLADHFGVLAASRHLAEVIDELKALEKVVEHEGGVLHVNDLYEQLPHKPEEPR